MNKRFRTTNGDNHLIDSRGNHFINTKCVNPKRGVVIECEDGVWREGEIGDTYPSENERIINNN